MRYLILSMICIVLLAGCQSEKQSTYNHSLEMQLGQEIEEIDTYENAAFLSHSDGFLFEYPLSWIDDTQLILPADSNENNLTGKVLLNLKNKQKSIIKDERLTDQLVEDIFTHVKEENFFVISSLLWSQDAKVAAFQAMNNQIWIYNTESRTFEFIGVGNLLGWMSSDNLIYTNTKHQSIVF